MSRMAKYDFNQPVDRSNTNAVKWEALKNFENSEELIPLWVADMDFNVPREVREAIVERAQHEVFGYTLTPDSYYEAVINWYRDIHNWEINKEEIIFTPGVVAGLNGIIRTFTDKDDSIIIQTPVYHQFAETIKRCGRNIVENPLKYEEGNYTMDFDNLREVISEETTMLILCNPHNPVGRSWTEEELKELGDICLENNILVVSDEIHADLTFKPKKHCVFSEVDERFKKNSIICTAPNKTFNIAGLATGNLIAQDQEIREKIEKGMENLAMTKGTIFGIIAQEAVYSHGKDWYEELMKYLEGNIDFVVDYIDKRIPEVKLYKPEATYLLWLDFSELGLNSEQLKDFLIKDCKLVLNEGSLFGQEYCQFQRMNIATNRTLLEKALKNLEQGIKNL